MPTWIRGRSLAPLGTAVLGYRRSDTFECHVPERIRPLAGGLEGWPERGLPLERLSLQPVAEGGP
jgi:hypothetical protein